MTHRKTFQYRLLSACLAILLSVSFSIPANAQSVLNLPAPGAMVTLSPPFNPPVLLGVKLHPDNPFRFEFVVDHGSEQMDDQQVRLKAEKLIRYFLAALTIPEPNIWVNLSPYEKNRIIPEDLGATELGRDLLAQDYLLKQISSSLIYPETDLGHQFWNKVYERVQNLYGIQDLPVTSFNKVWIVPDKAVVYEKEGTAFILESSLDVLMDKDYLSSENSDHANQKGETLKMDESSSKIFEEVVLPALRKEVNEGENFSEVRQIYKSLILAKWYKEKVLQSLLNQTYSNQSKIWGIDINGQKIRKDIYDQYIQAFKKGVFDYIKEDYDSVVQESIPRKYFSGGFTLGPNFNFSSGNIQYFQDNLPVAYQPRLDAVLQGDGQSGRSIVDADFIGIQRFPQMGKNARVINVIEREGTKYLQTVLRGEEDHVYEIALEPGEENFLTETLSLLESMLENPGHRRVVKLFLKLFQENPAHFFVYSQLFHDLFGVAIPDPEENLIALHDSLTKDLENAPIESKNSHLAPVFHEVGEILVGRGDLRLRMSEDKQTVTVSEPSGESFSVDVSGWTTHRFNEKNDTWINLSAENLNLLENQHYLLRILQAEIIPFEDDELSRRTVLERNRDVIEKVLEEKSGWGKSPEVKKLLTILFERGFMTQSNSEEMVAFIGDVLSGAGNFHGPQILESLLLWFSSPEISSENVQTLITLFEAISGQPFEGKKFEGYFYNDQAAYETLLALIKYNIVSHDTVDVVLDLFIAPFNLGLNLAHSYDFFQACGRPYFDAITRLIESGVITRNNLKQARDLFRDGLNVSTDTLVVEARAYLLMDLVRSSDGRYERYPLERGGLFTTELEYAFMEKGWLLHEHSQGEGVYRVSPSFQGVDEEFREWFASKSDFGRKNGLSKDWKKESRQEFIDLMEKSLRQSLGPAREPLLTKDNLSKGRVLFLMIHDQSRNRDNEEACLNALSRLLAKAQAEGVHLDMDLLIALVNADGWDMDKMFGFLEKYIERTRNLPVARQTLFHSDFLSRIVFNNNAKNDRILETFKKIDDVLFIVNKYPFEDNLMTQDFFGLLAFRDSRSLINMLTPFFYILALPGEKEAPPANIINFVFSPGVLKAMILCQKKEFSDLFWNMLSLFRERKPSQEEIIQYLYDNEVYEPNEVIVAETVSERILALTPERTSLSPYLERIYAEYEKLEHKIPRAKSYDLFSVPAAIDNTRATVEITVPVGSEQMKVFLTEVASLSNKRDQIESAAFSKYHPLMDALLASFPKDAKLYEFFKLTPYVFDLNLPSTKAIPRGGVGIHHDFMDQSVAVFHGMMNYLLQNEFVRIAMNTPERCLELHINEQFYKVNISEWTLSSLKREGQIWAKNIFEEAEGANTDHLLRLLQREVFGPQDASFFSYLNEQRMRPDIVEEMLGSEKAERERWRERDRSYELDPREKLTREMNQLNREILHMFVERGLVFREDKNKILHFFDAISPRISDPQPMIICDFLKAIMESHLLTQENFDYILDLLLTIADGKSLDETEFKGYANGGYENKNLALEILNRLIKDNILTGLNILDSVTLLKADFIKGDQGGHIGGEATLRYLQGVFEVISHGFISPENWSPFLHLIVSQVQQSKYVEKRGMSLKDGVTTGVIQKNNLIPFLQIVSIFSAVNMDNPIEFIRHFPDIMKAYSDDILNHKEWDNVIDGLATIKKISGNIEFWKQILQDKETVQRIFTDGRIPKLGARIRQEIEENKKTSSSFLMDISDALNYVSISVLNLDDLLDEADAVRKLIEIVHGNAIECLGYMKEIRMHPSEMVSLIKILPLNNPLTGVLRVLGKRSPEGFRSVVNHLYILSGEGIGTRRDLFALVQFIAQQSQRQAPQEVYAVLETLSHMEGYRDWSKKQWTDFRSQIEAYYAAGLPVLTYKLFSYFIEHQQEPDKITQLKTDLDLEIGGHVPWGGFMGMGSSLEKYGFDIEDELALLSRYMTIKDKTLQSYGEMAVRLKEALKRKYEEKEDLVDSGFRQLYAMPLSRTEIEYVPSENDVSVRRNLNQRLLKFGQRPFSQTEVERVIEKLFREERLEETDLDILAASIFEWSGVMRQAYLDLPKTDSDNLDWLNDWGIILNDRWKDILSQQIRAQIEKQFDALHPDEKEQVFAMIASEKLKKLWEEIGQGQDRERMMKVFGSTDMKKIYAGMVVNPLIKKMQDVFIPASKKIKSETQKYQTTKKAGEKELYIGYYDDFFHLMGVMGTAQCTYAQYPQMVNSSQYHFDSINLQDETGRLLAYGQIHLLKKGISVKEVPERDAPNENWQVLSVASINFLKHDNAFDQFNAYIAMLKTAQKLAEENRLQAAVLAFKPEIHAQGNPEHGFVQKLVAKGWLVEKDLTENIIMNSAYEYQKVYVIQIPDAATELKETQLSAILNGNGNGNHVANVSVLSAANDNALVTSPVGGIDFQGIQVVFKGDSVEVLYGLDQMERGAALSIDGLKVHIIDVKDAGNLVSF